MTSKRPGSVAMKIVAASTCWYAVSTSGNSAPTSSTVRRHRWPANQHVVLVDQGEVLARGGPAARAKASRTTRSTPKRVLTLTSVATSCGVPTRSAPPLPTYGPSVPSRTTTKSMPFGATRRRRAGWHARVELGRAQVDEVVEGEPQRQQHAALEDAAGHGRVADGPEQDRVVAAELLDAPTPAGSPRWRASGRAEVVLGRLHADSGGHGLEHLQALGDHLRADAVAADDGEVERGRGRRCTRSHTRQGTASRLSGWLFHIANDPRSVRSGGRSRPCATRHTARSEVDDRVVLRADRRGDLGSDVLGQRRVGVEDHQGRCRGCRCGPPACRRC
jgi:hypothetical protein